MPDMLRPADNPTSVTPESDERLVWATVVDNRYEAEVQRPEGAPLNEALFVVFDTYDGKVIHAEPIQVASWGKPGDKQRGAWQVMAMSAVDEHLKGATR